MSKLRVLIGFLVAPGLPALLLYLTVLFLGYASWEAAFFPRILGIFAYLAAWIFGIPGYFLLRGKGINGFMVYLILGALIGLTVYALYLFTLQPSVIEYRAHINWGLGLMAIVYAVISTAIFWLIAVQEIKAENERVLIGFLVAPGLPALLAYLVGLFVGEAAFFLGIIAIFAYLAAWICGIPGYILLRREGINSFAAYLVWGALFGLIVYGISLVALLFNWQIYPEMTVVPPLGMILKDITLTVLLALIAITYAVISTALFWLIAVRKTKAEKAAGQAKAAE